jgi:hypothetical protein
MSIQDRVRNQLAKIEKDRKAAERKAERKAGEHSRRSHAARMAHEMRKDQRIEDLISGKVQPRNSEEQMIVWRSEGASVD